MELDLEKFLKQDYIFKTTSRKLEEFKKFFMDVKFNNYSDVKSAIFLDRNLIFLKDKTLSTPLHWSCKRGYVKIASILLK